MDKLVSPVAHPTPIQFVKAAGEVVTTGVTAKLLIPTNIIADAKVSADPNLQT